jgi:cell division septum initiation protein DivIVA
VDLLKAIRELQDEKKHLDRIIDSLEQMVAEGTHSARRTSGKRMGRRGRKTMSSEERKQVSERMAKYWASRRAKPPKQESAG